MPFRLIDHLRLKAVVGKILGAAGMAAESARVTAHFLVEADMTGYSTHGVALVGRYAGSLSDGTMNGTAEPQTLRQHGNVTLIDGHMAPGLYTLASAVAHATEQARACGAASVVVRNAHHAGALGVFLLDVVENGMMGIIASSSPGVAVVAPHGGKSGVLSPNPIAFGIPTSDTPVIMDMSSSITTLGRARAAIRSGERLPGHWAINADGEATDDGSVLWDDRPGALLPLGGIDHGYKGFALGLLVEALTQGLGGYGRAEAPNAWTNALYVHVADPQWFGGREDFSRQMDHLVAMCLAAEAADAETPVRLPGAQALARRRKAMSEGVAVADDTLAMLDQLATTFGVPPLDMSEDRVGPA